MASLDLVHMHHVHNTTTYIYLPTSIYAFAGQAAQFCRILTQFAGHVNQAMHDVIF